MDKCAIWNCITWEYDVLRQIHDGNVIYHKIFVVVFMQLLANDVNIRVLSIHLFIRIEFSQSNEIPENKSYRFSCSSLAKEIVIIEYIQRAI